MSCTVNGASPDAHFRQEQDADGATRIRSIAKAETLDAEAGLDTEGEKADEDRVNERRTKRIRTANRHYQSDAFWRHYDEDAWDASDLDVE